MNQGMNQCGPTKATGFENFLSTALCRLLTAQAKHGHPYRSTHAVDLPATRTLERSRFPAAGQVIAALSYFSISARPVACLASALLLAACSFNTVEHGLTQQQKIVCGQQCLKNGEVCSQFFGRKNEQQRLSFEQAKENYWLCLRKQEAGQTVSRCLPPTPATEQFDSCGAQLDACLESCKTTLEELAVGVRQ